MKRTQLNFLCLLALQTVCAAPAAHASATRELDKFINNSGEYRLADYAPNTSCAHANPVLSVQVMPEQESVSVKAASTASAPAVDLDLVIGGLASRPRFPVGEDLYETRFIDGRIETWHYQRKGFWKELQDKTLAIAFIDDNQVEFAFYVGNSCRYVK